MASMLTELERKLPKVEQAPVHKPYRGVCATWDDAMRVAHHITRRTGRRHRVTFAPSKWDTMRWAVREVEAPSA